MQTNISLKKTRMTAFHHLIRFEAAEDEGIFFADLGPGADGPPRIGESIAAYSTIGDLLDKRDSKTAVIQRVGGSSSERVH